MHRNVEHLPSVFTKQDGKEFNFEEAPIHEAATRIIRFPTVASKSFLITIGDRSVTGLFYFFFLII